MRQPLNNPEVHFLKYQIREIVDVVQKLKEIDPAKFFVMENIGDPIAKSWTVPPFLKEAIVQEIQRPGDKVFGYSHSRGLPDVRKWVVDHAKKMCPSSNLDYEYVLFTSGLGSAIALVYEMLPQGFRVVQPAPSYPTHSSMESFFQKQDPISYHLDPRNGWQPDMAHLEQQIVAHPDVGAILLINPNNPTGAVYEKETLEQIVLLAQKYNLFIISDEVYFRMVYNGKHHTHIVDIAAGRVPLVVLRGLSKDLPWPGGRCGWIEFHDIDLDSEYRAYADALRQRILMEVCSTSLPQFIVRAVYDHPEFSAWIAGYNQELEKNGNFIAETLSRVPGMRVNRTDGAFYMMPLFEEGVLNNRQTLPIENDAVRTFIESAVNRSDFPLDQRFTYYLLGATGICVVPATGFYSPHYGFRLTTLERDDAKRKDTYERLAGAITQYLSS
ncbi:MAG TPA: aminotransferase [Candidatus Magasanikbacteria bacterium]|nr:MAG: hypothetical protein A3I74_04295 [Candidatus Magasanikbacteria bacterium RIFCSPLOWO2_02_FULL_47_16]OGH79377.1 MAG: hypothetical protein A3C10_04830 [Candidatus Magasanikbacteria bacterium RIFCSPHIGHO2_02_FULL_48_18]OGH83529.1 MAG: hypothetical protein A3G08_00440 [Candidatus Magasanikbacteria bacterium RIFCSPLOWO2_12_FULL_47_9b]HAZ28762.1 aminotransferase [Candidatus Magasanikbacteria bacterium]